MHSTTLVNAQQAHEVLMSLWAWAKPRLMAGHRLRLSVAEAPRTLPQNDHIQKLTRNIGLKLGHKDHDRLRMLLVEQWRFETGRQPQHTASFDGQRMVDTGNRSSALDTPDASEFIEWLKATEANL